MIEETRQTVTYGEPVHITLTKYQKGYGWEIGVRGIFPDVILLQIETIDNMLKEKYLPKEVVIEQA